MKSGLVAKSQFFRRWTAAALERACRLSGLGNEDLCVQLAELTGRDHRLASQTLFDWRHGVNAVPFEIFAAACFLARTDPRSVIALDPVAAGVDLKTGFEEPNKRGNGFLSSVA